MRDGGGGRGTEQDGRDDDQAQRYASDQQRQQDSADGAGAAVGGDGHAQQWICWSDGLRQQHRRGGVRGQTCQRDQRRGEHRRQHGRWALRGF